MSDPGAVRRAASTGGVRAAGSRRSSCTPTSRGVPSDGRPPRSGSGHDSGRTAGSARPRRRWVSCRRRWCRARRCSCRATFVDRYAARTDARGRGARIFDHRRVDGTHPRQADQDRTSSPTGRGGDCGPRRRADPGMGRSMRTWTLDGHVDSSNHDSGRGVEPVRGDSATGRPAQTRRLIPRRRVYLLLEPSAGRSRVRGLVPRRFRPDRLTTRRQRGGHDLARSSPWPAGTR